MDINEDLLQWFINCLIKSIQVVVLFKTEDYLKNYTSQLLENPKNEKHTHLLKTMFGVWICNYEISLIKEVVLFCVIDIYTLYVRGVPLKDQKGIAVTNAFQNIVD